MQFFRLARYNSLLLSLKKYSYLARNYHFTLYNSNKIKFFTKVSCFFWFIFKQPNFEYMKLIISLLFSFLITNSPGQSLTYKVTYTFYHVTDTNNLGSVHKEVMAINFNNNAAQYYSETGKEQSELWKKRTEEAERTGSTSIDLGHVTKITNEKIFTFPDNKKIFIIRKFQRNEYEIPEQLPDFKWKIMKQIKMIKGYNCQLATGFWRGRTYHAWFTSDLPYPYGPWKINGLPGIVLEATDETNTVRFECDSIYKNTDESTISLPEDAIVTTQPQYNKMVGSMRNVNKQISNGNSESSMQVQLVSPSTKGEKTRSISSFNNPIELKTE